MTVEFIIGIILITLLVIYWSKRFITWAIIFGFYLAIVYVFAHDRINIIVFDIVLIIYAIKLSLIAITPLRKKLLTNPIAKVVHKVLPKISPTEQLALNAGDPWYEKEIFCGNPDFELLHNIKKFSLTQEEQSFLDNETNQLCAMIKDWDILYKDKDLPSHMWDFIRDKGFFGLVIAKEFGGKGFSAAAHSEIVMKIATRSSTVAVTVMVPNSLGPGELLYHYGTTEQKEYYLPRLARGTEIPCFALTGPHAGSDATSIPDRGDVCMGEYNGKQVLGIRLTNVDKRYITLAPVATLVGLAFRLFDNDNLLNGVGKTGITCALLPHDHPGLEIGNRLLPLNQVFMNGTVRIKESFIPIEWVIGGQSMTGEGWRMLVECLSIGRAISLPACGVANSLLASVTTSAYAVIREQFKVAIGEFEGVEEVLARMGGLTYMMNATRQFTVTSVDVGIRPSVASAISKYHLTENGRLVLNGAMDIHGGRGIIMGPNNYLGSVYQGVPVGITVEGANIMTRNLMIFGQGALRCHPYLRTEYEALAGDNFDLASFDKALFGHIGYFMHNSVRAIFSAFTCGIFAKGHESKFNSYYKQISRLSSAFAHINDLTLITLGGEIKRRERISARLGDTMSYLYMACSSLKYFKDNGEIKSDEVFLTWTLDYCLYNAMQGLFEVLDNFSIPALGVIVKRLMFPYGAIYHKPSDKLEHKLSQSLLYGCETRERFKQMCYIPEDNSNDAIGRIELAYKAVLETLSVKTKIHNAIKTKVIKKSHGLKAGQNALEANILTKEEFNLLVKANTLVEEVIQVDEFKASEIGPRNAHPTWQ